MGFIMLTKKISGIANGTSAVLETGSDVLTAFLTNLTFYSNAERTNIIIPASGTVLLEYSSSGQVWHVFTGGRIDLALGRIIDPYANNSRILYIRATFAGIPSQPVYFSADFFLLGSNGPAIDPRVYAGLQSFTTQLFTEANVKNGTQFSASAYFTGLEAGELLDTIVITGDKPVIVKAQHIAVKDSADVVSAWYRGPTYTGGSDLTAGIYNQTDIDPAASTIQLFGPTPTNPAAGDYSPNNATKPKVTNLGTQITPVIVTLGVAGGGQNHNARNTLIGLDHILHPNTTYLYRRQAVGATASFYGFSTWYEGPLSVDL